MPWSNPGLPCGSPIDDTRLASKANTSVFFYPGKTGCGGPWPLALRLVQYPQGCWVGRLFPVAPRLFSRGSLTPMSPPCTMYRVLRQDPVSLVFLRRSQLASDPTVANLDPLWSKTPSAKSRWSSFQPARSLAMLTSHFSPWTGPSSLNASPPTLQPYLDHCSGTVGLSGNRPQDISSHIGLKDEGNGRQ